ncbi:MAG: type I DNA topoisomerase [Chloroflexi bacterium]|nr:type I DNA topoisomerase [Chloroflexota bacterium]
MAKNLVIVESPAKAKAIGKYLGSDYVVKASVGHVRDLPEKGLGVDIEAGFAPQYVVPPGKEKIISELARAAGSSEVIYLATDPDREGEAIAWHISLTANCAPEKTRRVTFHQVTPDAVREAIAHPRGLDTSLIDAQQARRVLDRLVGYQISPLLNKAAKNYGQHTLSAGRVQSVALRLVVERERAIMAFVPVEYWTLDALLKRRQASGEQFQARLVKVRGQEPQLRLQQDVDILLKNLETASYNVQNIEHGNRQQNPPPPFITSTLQAEAGRKLHYTPRQTMRLAQQLYEGIELGGETTGLITYMRTDSTQVAGEAQQQARKYVHERWGASYIPAKPPYYRSKVANAQEAHEAIRPTNPMRAPETVAAYLDKQQLALYELIWRRFMASQMKAALFATTSIDILAGTDYLFRANGFTLLFPGYKVVYSEARDDDHEEQEVQLPEVNAGEQLDLLQLLPEQHFTEPLPRYSEATLIKELEKNGVGRPSTYATIIGVIEDRGYVLKDKGRLSPTDIGFVVCDTLVHSFEDIMDVHYTAGMEEQLDQVASGDLNYTGMLSGFYKPFSSALAAAADIIPDALRDAVWADLPGSMGSEICPTCGKALRMRLNDAGRFLACSGYPECRYTRDLPSLNGQQAELTYAPGETCELCGGRMKVLTKGKNKFLGCENYPACKNTRAILSAYIKQVAAEQACPTCGTKPLSARKGRFGEYLYCPQCKTNISLAKLGLKKKRAPRQEAAPAELATVSCPKCHRPTMERRTGKYGPYYRCPDCRENYSAKKLGLSAVSDET